MKPTPPRPELDALLEAAKKLPPMTTDQSEAQRKSFVIGQLLLMPEYWDKDRAWAEEVYEQARKRGY